MRNHDQDIALIAGFHDRASCRFKNITYRSINNPAAGICWLGNANESDFDFLRSTVDSWPSDLLNHILRRRNGPGTKNTISRNDILYERQSLNPLAQSLPRQ